MTPRNNSATECSFLAHQEPLLVNIGSVAADLRALCRSRRSGNKHDATLIEHLGGFPLNTGIHGVANGLPTSVISVQQQGFWANFCRHLGLQRGIRMILAEWDTGPAASLIVPNGKPGQFDIFRQRMHPLTVNELTPEMKDAFRTARAVFVGPMRWTPHTRDLIAHIPALACRGTYLALLPHRDMIADPSFPFLATKYNYV